MFDLMKSFVWIAIMLILAYFIMSYFGYEPNLDYFSTSKEVCQQKIKDCTNNVIHNGINNTDKCNFNCINPKLIIKKVK
ncbi:MAG: hypothetical protein UT50_C0001G0060 [Candidatus Moranbacteria bacterium GW2011_GWA2_39_41]|nr:MAG: hypothetical protein UT50_C0001G0060 [Candidatus Moranbacteria bacterium GW2011_GWA2_39_41]